MRNGSFEDHVSCPSSQDQLPLCEYWVKANGCTTDYVCTCSPDPNFGVQAPNYWMGYQQPFHGNCYMGLYGYGDIGNGIDLLASEFIQTNLTDSLKPFHKYRLSMYVSLSNHSEFTIHNFGALVSATRPDDGLWCDTFSTYHPQLIVTYITDTLNWVKQEVEFIAEGGEKWLTIGRFDFDGPSQIMNVIPDTSPPPPFRYAYYVVDSVSIYDVTDPENLPDLQNVISPNGDGSNDFFLLPEFDFLQNETLKIYTRWGNEVVVLNQFQNKWGGIHQNGNEIHSGTYFYIFTAITEEGKIIYKKGTVTVYR